MESINRFEQSTQKMEAILGDLLNVVGSVGMHSLADIADKIQAGLDLLGVIYPAFGAYLEKLEKEKNANSNSLQVWMQQVADDTARERAAAEARLNATRRAHGP